MPRKTGSGVGPHGAHEDVPGKITAALERLGQALRVLAREEAQRQGLSPIGLQLVLRLAGLDDPGRPGRLAREFRVSPASLSDSLRALERKGLVERRRDGDDRRGFSFRLTPAGRLLAGRLEPLTSPVRAAAAALPAEEQLTLLLSLYELIADLQRRGVITVARMCVTCSHFRADAHGPNAHHCTLLDLPLARPSLRIDCPEHELAA
jgi:DNA-binding MarR family transcriptional regulator